MSIEHFIIVLCIGNITKSLNAKKVARGADIFGIYLGYSKIKFEPMFDCSLMSRYSEYSLVVRYEDFIKKRNNVQKYMVNKGTY